MYKKKKSTYVQQENHLQPHTHIAGSTVGGFGGLSDFRGLYDHTAVSQCVCVRVKAEWSDSQNTERLEGSSVFQHLFSVCVFFDLTTVCSLSFFESVVNRKRKCFWHKRFKLVSAPHPVRSRSRTKLFAKRQTSRHESVSAASTQVKEVTLRLELTCISLSSFTTTPMISNVLLDRPQRSKCQSLHPF